MRILFVAMADSVHTARWIAQLRDTGWDLHLFPAIWPCRADPDLDGVTLHGVGWWRPPGLRPGVKVAGLWPPNRGAYRLEQWRQRWLPQAGRSWQLARVIRRLQPTLVHSLEMQRAGYLTLESRQHLGAVHFPPWIYSCWGNDLYHFGRQPEHAARVRAVLAGCDYFIADCARDLELARELGLRGRALGVFPTGGGYAVEALQALREGPPATRRVILVKGYQNWAGRALVALQAVHRCADALQAYEIAVYSAPPEVAAVAQHVAAMTGLRVRVLAAVPHAELLRWMGRARVAVGMNVTDGTPNTMLEAMIMGALPVQSDTISTREWITDGVNGLLVPPEDVNALVAALRRAVSDGALVTQAAEHNARLARERLDENVIRPQVTAMYRQVAE